MGQYQLVVLSNPKAGCEQAYNEWYSRVHVPEILAIPGIVSARRLQLLGERAARPYEYLALYEIETDDIDAVLARLADSSRRTSSDAVDMGATVAWMYEMLPEQRSTA